MRNSPTTVKPKNLLEALELLDELVRTSSMAPSYVDSATEKTVKDASAYTRKRRQRTTEFKALPNQTSIEQVIKSQIVAQLIKQLKGSQTQASNKARCVSGSELTC